ncbi:MAG: hypothetical protein K2H98_02855 [Duncaniella sp.]|nr:hypothetical protein [Duncaniella sp.]
MKHPATYIIISLVATLSVASCARTDIDKSPADPVQILRLDSAALSGDSAAFMASGDAASLWLRIVGADSSDLSGYFSSLQGKPYNEPVASQFVSTDSLAAKLGYIFNNVERLTDIVPPAVVATVVSPYNQSVVTADSVVYIALNHYLGPEHEFYAWFPDYQRRLKHPSRIGADVVEAVISEKYPFSPAAKYPTALSRIAAEGAVVEAVMQLTGASEQEALGYDADEYRWLLDNERQAWESLLARNLIFTTDPSIVETLVRPNSVTSCLHPEAPGRAGRFIGHRIVAAYLDSHPSATLTDVLSPDFYNDPKLLEKAGYVAK